MFKLPSRCIFSIIFFCFSVGCDFHLRGAFEIPNSLQVIRILPKQPNDPFQRFLIKTFISNGVQISKDSNDKENVTLTLLNQVFSERNVAYGSDGQPNRVLLRFSVNYQISNAQGKLLISSASVQVEREFTINPTAYLATDNERTRLKSDLITDAASQLVRQLSSALLS